MIIHHATCSHPLLSTFLGEPCCILPHWEKNKKNSTNEHTYSHTISFHLLGACGIGVRVVTPAICNLSIISSLLSLHGTDASLPHPTTAEYFMQTQPKKILWKRKMDRISSGNVQCEAFIARVPGISKPRSGGAGVVRLHPTVFSPSFGCLLLLFLLLSLDVLCICLDLVALCIAAGVHSCV